MLSVRVYRCTTVLIWTNFLVFRESFRVYCIQYTYTYPHLICQRFLRFKDQRRKDKEKGSAATLFGCYSFALQAEADCDSFDKLHRGLHIHAIEAGGLPPDPLVEGLDTGAISVIEISHDHPATEDGCLEGC